MVRRTRLSAGACACLLSMLVVSRVARAQVSPEEKAAAEAVFQEGMRLIKQGNFADACPKFETSQRVEPAVGTMLYLAECYEKTNRSASAWAMFREAASLAETQKQFDRQKTAEMRAARLEPRLAWLTIDVPKESIVPGLQIRRNSVLVSSELSGIATPVDPGEVQVEASAPGRLPYSTKVKVAAKARVSVPIPLLQAAPDAAPAVVVAPVVAQPENAQPAPVAPAPQTPTPQPSAAPAPAAASHTSPIPWIVGGVGVAALGVGTVFGLKAIESANEARDTCPKNICNDAQGATAADSAHTQATISNVSFAIGGVALATGVVLFFALPTKHGTQVGLSPMVAPTTFGLSLHGKLEL